MPAIKIVIFLLIVTVPQHHGHRHYKSYYKYHLINILKSRDNFFKEFSKTTQKVVNGIFDSLSVSEQFTKDPKIKSLLTMEHDLNNIAEKNFQLYDVLRNASAVEVDDKPINQIRMNELIIEILNKININVNNKTEKNSFEYIQRKSRAESSSEFANSKEFKSFIGGFIGKLKTLTVEDLFPKKNNGSSSEWEQSGRRNLKIWEPPSRDDTYIYNMGNRRIYRGETTNIVTYPFVVSIHVRGECTCAGSIISMDLIITAASCLKPQYKTYVRLNSDYTSRLGEQIPVLEIYLYPQYDPKTLHHNLAILRLQRSLKTSTLISLDRGNSNIPPNTEITILGWGAEKPNQIVNQNEKITYAVLKAYHIDECAEIYSKTYVTENNFCAGFKTKGSGACNRDVGGPGIIDNLLFGVISFGAPVCGGPDAPTAFTRVGAYIDWIDYIMSLRPIKQEIEANIKPGDKILIYYNTPPKNDPRMYPVNKYHTSGPLTPVLRAHDGDTPEEPINAVILQQIINDMNNKNGMLYDIINDDLYDDFVDIFKPDQDQSIIHHPLINKTQYLISGIHYNVSTVTLPSAVTRQYIPTFLLRSTPAEILRHKKEPKQHNASSVAITEYLKKENAI